VPPPAANTLPTMQAFDTTTDGSFMTSVIVSPEGRLLVGYQSRSGAFDAPPAPKTPRK
jgi:hypothetical protein